MTYRRSFQKMFKESGLPQSILISLVIFYITALLFILGEESISLTWPIVQKGLGIGIFSTLLFLIVGTLAEKSMPEYIKEKCKLYGVPYTPYDTETGE